ncbi:hypothetical protein PG995_014819 [Apiospora arundinis]
MPCISPLASRNLPNHTQMIIGSVVLQMVRCYPFMLLSKDTFPPFVNAHLYSSSKKVEGPPLQHAASVVSAFKARTEISKEHIWNLIRIEQERIILTHHSWDIWERLAAFQALLVFCLLRLFDRSTE